MKIGKITADELQDQVLNKINFHHRDVLLHAGIGEDSAVVDLGEKVLVVSSDPITGAVKNAGYLAVHVSCNDLAATGAEPVGLQVVLLLPESIKKETISKLMTDIHNTAAEIEVEILGGHTEVVSSVSQPIIVITGVGKADKDKYLSTGGAKTGDDIIYTKGLGIEGIYILANDYSDYLIEKGVPIEIIKKAQKYGEKLSVLPESRIAIKHDVHGMHDITEGGLYGALDEMSQAANKGFEIFIDNLELNNETEIITEKLGLDPAGLLSSGSMLMTVSDGKRIINELQKNGIKAWKIGNVRDKGCYIKNNQGKSEKFKWSEEDELWKWMDKYLS